MALILAGGTGSRMGRPKQFIELLGQPALLYALRAFEEAPGVGEIYTVGDRTKIEALVNNAGIGKYAGCASPGESRSLSTRNGLLLCAGGPETLILIHDGSRCLVTPDLIERVIAVADGPVDGAVPTLPVSDTVKVIEEGHVLKTMDRDRLHATQTPQAFRLGLLRRIYAAPEEVLHAATDDASLVERAGGTIATVPGEKANIKLTTPEDLILAEAFLSARQETGS